MEPDDIKMRQDIDTVMATLPPVIREYLAGGQYTTIAKDMMAEHKLRLDQGGVLEREIMLLLMGIDDPDEFMKALDEEAHLDAQMIKNIVAEVNEKIFVPLRAKEEGQGMGGEAPRGVVPEVRPSLRPAVASSEGVPEIPKVEPQTQDALQIQEPPLPPAVMMPRHAEVSGEGGPTPIKTYAADPYREPVDEPVDEVL